MMIRFVHEKVCHYSYTLCVATGIPIDHFMSRSFQLLAYFPQHSLDWWMHFDNTIVEQYTYDKRSRQHFIIVLLSPRYGMDFCVILPRFCLDSLFDKQMQCIQASRKWSNHRRNVFLTFRRYGHTLVWKPTALVNVSTLTA